MPLLFIFLCHEKQKKICENFLYDHAYIWICFILGVESKNDACKFTFPKLKFNISTPLSCVKCNLASCRDTLLTCIVGQLVWDIFFIIYGNLSLKFMFPLTDSMLIFWLWSGPKTRVCFTALLLHIVLLEVILDVVK